MSSPIPLLAIRAELGKAFFERAEAIEALTLAALTRQHAFILGPPGTGKSLLVREFCSRFTGASYFEQLLSKNRPDSAVLGPYDLPLLRDSGEFRRKDDGYLTTADFAFLDEVGKASPTLGHDLLAALNERIKHEVCGTRSAAPIPLHSAFTASNELPAADSEDEAALWDRLLVRCVVDSIAHPGAFKALLERDDEVPSRTTMPFADLVSATEAVAQVIVLDDVLDAVMAIRASLRKDGITISDRRWRESMKVIRATAFLGDRGTATVADAKALRFTLWEDLTQRQKVEKAILVTASPVDAEVADVFDSVKALAAEIAAKEGESDEKLLAFAAEAMGKLKAALKKGKALRTRLSSAGQPLAGVEEMLTFANSTQARLINVLGIGE